MAACGIRKLITYYTWHCLSVRVSERIIIRRWIMISLRILFDIVKCTLINVLFFRFLSINSFVPIIIIIPVVRCFLCILQTIYQKCAIQRVLPPYSICKTSPTLNKLISPGSRKIDIFFSFRKIGHVAIKQWLTNELRV